MSVPTGRVSVPKIQSDSSAFALPFLYFSHFFLFSFLGNEIVLRNGNRKKIILLLLLVALASIFYQLANEKYCLHDNILIPQMIFTFFPQTL